VRDVLDTFALAFQTGDVGAAIATYADDVVAYDLAPPLAQSPAMVRDQTGLE